MDPGGHWRQCEACTRAGGIVLPPGYEKYRNKTTMQKNNYKKDGRSAGRPGSDKQTSSRDSSPQPSKRNTNRQLAKRVAIEQSLLDGEEKRAKVAEHEEKKENERQRKAKVKRENMERVRKCFDNFEMTIYHDEPPRRLTLLIFLVNMAALTVYLLGLTNPSMKFGTAAGWTIYVLVSIASLGTAEFATQTKGSTRGRVVGAVALYCTFIITITIIQVVWGTAMSIAMLVVVTEFVILIIVYGFMLYSESVWIRRYKFNRVWKAKYKVTGFPDIETEDVRPDCNSKKEIKYESVKMNLLTQDSEHPLSAQTMTVCAETTLQILGPGVLSGTGDLTAAASALSGAMRRLSSVNQTKMVSPTNGLLYERTLHFAKAILKASQQSGTLVEPDLGF
jgi:hypothetical protein